MATRRTVTNGFSPLTSPRKGRTRFGSELEQAPTVTHSKYEQLPSAPSNSIASASRSMPSTEEFRKLQKSLETLEKTLKQTKSLLKESERSAEWWKSRVKVLDKRSRALETENKILMVRVTELEVGKESKSSTLSITSTTTEANKENVKPLKAPEVLDSQALQSKSDEEESKKYTTAIRSLITHHWNLQAELANGNDCCDCAAARTVQTLLLDAGSSHTPLPLDKEKKPAVVEEEQLKLPPHPHPELFTSLKKERKKMLKRKVKEMRYYVDGLMNENVALERLIMEGMGSPPKSELTTTGAL